MTSIKPGKLMRFALVIGTLTVAVGCFPPPTYYQSTPVQPVQTVAPAQTAVASPAYGYTPQYYNGYVVYFDRSGYPFYYLNGAVTYVPRTYSNYTYLVNHYRTFGVNYQRWYSAEGHRLHSLRVNLGL
jgi:hypothetical protein